MPETAGGAAVLADPKAPASIARAIVEAAGPARDRLRDLGPAPGRPVHLGGDGRGDPGRLPRGRRAAGGTEGNEDPRHRGGRVHRLAHLRPAARARPRGRGPRRADPARAPGRPAQLPQSRGRLLPGRRPQPRSGHQPAPAGGRGLPLRRLPGLPDRLLPVLRRERGLDRAALRDHRGRAPRPGPGRGGVVAVGHGRRALPVPGRRRAAAGDAPGNGARGGPVGHPLPGCAAARWRCRPRPSGSRTRRTRTACPSSARRWSPINLGRRYGIPTVALRYSIVQGPRQSVYNAYSGACRIFCLSYLQGMAPTLYEDGGGDPRLRQHRRRGGRQRARARGRPRRRAGLQRRRRSGGHDHGVRRHRQAPVRLRRAGRGDRRVPFRRHPPHPVGHQRPAGAGLGTAAHARRLGRGLRRMAGGHGRPRRRAGRGERPDARARRGPEGGEHEGVPARRGGRQPAAADHRHHPEVHAAHRRPAPARHLAGRVRPGRRRRGPRQPPPPARGGAPPPGRAGRRRLSVRTVFEPDLLGSAGTLVANRGWVDGEEFFLACNADNLTDFDLRSLIDAHREHGAIATLAVFHSPQPVGRRRGGSSMPTAGSSGSPRSPASRSPTWPTPACTPSTRAVLDEIDGAPPTDIGYDLLPRLVGRARAVPVEGYFRDIGTADAYRQAREEWPVRAGR